MRRLLSLSLAVLFTILAGCGDPAGLDENSHVGTYTLETMEGNALPYTYLQSGDAKAEVVSGFITLNADQTFVGSTTIRVTRSSGVSTSPQTAGGTYTRSGETITLSTSGGSTPHTAKLRGNTLTIVESQMFYRK